MTALDFVTAHDGNLIDCTDEELMQFSKVALLEALCIFWGCLPTSGESEQNNANRL